MAASSPRKPRRARGRHRKPATFPPPECAQWVRVGVVGTGLAAAIACGQGVASASTDDPSNSGESAPSTDGAKNAGNSTPAQGVTRGARTDDDADDADDAAREEISRTSDRRAASAGPARGAGQEDPDDAPDGVAGRALPLGGDPEKESDIPTPAGPALLVQDVVETLDAGAPPITGDLQEATDILPPVESEPVVQQIDPPGSTRTVLPDEPTETLQTAFAAEQAPTAAAAPAAFAALNAAAPPAPGTSEWYFQGTLQRAVTRLAGWPGPPRNFVDITNYQTDRSFDLANDQLDSLIAAAPFGSPVRWLPDLLNMVGAFFAPAVPNTKFTDALNAMGDFLNRVVPPFKIAEGADTLDVITPYKIMGAAVVGTATVLQDMLNGIYDPAQWAIDVVKTTTGATITRSDLTDFGSLSGKVVAAQAAALLGGDGGAFDEPERALNITLPTWTEAQVNPFTLVTYVALVGMYKRFQEMAVLTTFTTNTTYDSWNYTISLGSQSTRSQYAAGTFHVTDPDGNGVKWIAVSQGGTYTSEGGALVTINNANGGFTYTNTLPGAGFFHRSTSEVESDRYDIVYIPVQSADGVRYTLPFKVEIIDGTNANPTGSSAVIGTDLAAVVKARVTGTDSDGDTMTYSLVGTSVNGLSGNSAYTKNGLGNGGIVTINPVTGEITYASTATAGISQNFQVRIGDGHYGSTVVTVTVPNTATVTPANVNTSTPYIVTGSVPASTYSQGLFKSFALGAAPTKGSVTAFDPATGNFTYTSNAGRIAANDDVVTVIATDVNGRSVTLQMAVKPTVTNNVPVVLSTAIDKGSTDPTKWRLDTVAGDNRTQTTTGKITATDADGDALTYSLVDSVTHVPVTNTPDGGAVTFGPDGSFIYTITKNKSFFHAAAKIGASAADVNDTFTVKVTDNFTGSAAYTTVTMPTYAANSAPTISGFGGIACAFWTCTVGTMTVSDPDGDSIPNANVTPGAGAGRTLATGSVTTWGNGVTAISWGAGGTFGTTATANTFTVYDGYYTVTNGVINVSNPTKFWAQWAAGSGTRTTGN